MQDMQNETNDEQKQTGVVKWFNATKGYGFIAPDNQDEDNQDDLFVHINDVLDDQPLQEGDRVSFIVVEGRKGPAAAKVTRI